MKKLYKSETIKRIFTRKNFNKVLIIFIIGFSSRALIGYIYEINVFNDYLNPISIIYYTAMSLLAVVVHEVITVFNISIIPSFIFKLFSIFSCFAEHAKQENKMYLTNDSSDAGMLDKAKQNKAAENIQNKYINSKRRSDISKSSERSSNHSSRNEVRGSNYEERRHRRHRHIRSVNSSIQPREDKPVFPSTYSIPIGYIPPHVTSISNLSNLSTPSDPLPILPSTYSIPIGYIPPHAPSISNLSTPSDLSSVRSGMFPPLNVNKNLPLIPAEPSNLSTPSNLSATSGMYPGYSQYGGNNVEQYTNYATRNWDMVSRTTPSTTYTSHNEEIRDENPTYPRESRAVSNQIDWNERRAKVREGFNKNKLKFNNHEGKTIESSPKFFERLSDAIKSPIKDFEEEADRVRRRRDVSGEENDRLMKTIRGARDAKNTVRLERLNEAYGSKHSESRISHSRNHKSSK